ncbi:hypothetical protein EO087_13150 [Dyella sp. M7H15-1]|uniref:hypothetical protein n=1 Tax=Dyella sp. M7H15-1 TaxID=2501295 RepID=UPI001004D66B|nr:hypothetical protein [Dyella sp. M7H15-1]QAU24818.1 hypothetical protein EO087_13150 [Dyella sp. M7H15-1]
MDLAAVFSGLSDYMHSAEFRDLARHPEHPNAFTRQRKLPLPTLVTLLVSGMRKSFQAEVDEFFARVRQQVDWVREVILRAIALCCAPKQQPASIFQRLDIATVTRTPGSLMLSLESPEAGKLRLWKLTVCIDAYW